MVISDNPFRATLVTKGRKTGEKHSVVLRGVRYNNRIYFSRHRPDSDWFKNAIVNSRVEILLDDFQYQGIAKKITDDTLNEKISKLKYPGEQRANEKRISIEITLCEQ